LIEILFYLQNKTETNGIFQPQHFRAIQLLGHHFNEYFESISVAYAQVSVLSMLVCCTFGLIRFSEVVTLLPKTLLLFSSIIANMVLYIECSISDLTGPSNQLLRIYCQLYKGQKTWIAMIKSFRPLQLNLGCNFARPRKYLYLVLLFRLSRLLSTLLVSYPADRIHYEN